MQEMTSDSEWNRLLSNPDGFMMSQSLKDRGLVFLHINESLRIHSKEKSLPGELISFGTDCLNDKPSYVLKCKISKSAFADMLSWDNFDKIEIPTEGDINVYNLSKNQKWNAEKSENELFLEISWLKE